MLKMKKNPLSDAVIFTISNYFATALSFISSFITRKVLGPFMMGVFTELMLIFDYCRFHHLGVINALEREVPFYNAKFDFGRVGEIKKTTFAFIILSALNIGAILIIISFFGGVHKVGLRFVAILVLIEAIVSFYEVLLQAYNRFKLWSLFVIGIGFLDIFLKVIFVIKFGLNGLLTAMVLTGLASIVLYHLRGNCKIDFSAKIYLKEIMHLLKLGIPLISVRLMYLLSSSIDKLAIIFFLGRLQLGYYSIATMVSNYLILLPKFSYKTLYPKFIETFGRNENIEDVKKYLIAPNRVFASLFSILIGLVIIIIPFLVTYLLPHFKQGIFAAQIATFATFFSALIYTWNYLLIALYEQKRLALLYGLSAIISIIINLFFIGILHMQINGIAFATLISQFLFTTILICYGYRFYTKRFLEHLKLLFILYLPFLWIIVAMLGWKFYYPKQVSFREDFLGLVTSCSMFLIVSSPFIYHTIKREELLRFLFKSLEIKNE